jgi:nitroimidazol reductase NimA-like FMN-containing flavoprotein (pyridoxamine 5'-phosphate oxidase superfamily)
MVQRKATSTTNLDIYGNAVLDWDRADRALSNPPSDMQTWFLGTVDPDGRPHATGVGAFYLDGDMYFTSGPGTRKSRNLAANPACTISVALAGIDVVLEGEAERVTDSGTLEQVAAAAREGGWPAQVEGDALTAPYSAPSAGPAPWHMYRLKVHTVYGVATAEPYGATRWRFS